MMGNYTLGDCTCAAAGHMVQCWTVNTGDETAIPARQIVKAYEAVSGYNPKTGKNDNGAQALDVLRYWRKNGIGGHKIVAFASVNHRDKKMIREAIYLFGGIYAGIQLPKSIKGQQVWEEPPAGLKGKGAVGSLGGHAIAILDYDDTGLTCITWGKKRKMTWDFWEAYADEAYGVLSEQFFKGKKTPAGLDLKALEADLLNITREKISLVKELTGKKPDAGARATPKKSLGNGKSAKGSEPGKVVKKKKTLGHSGGNGG